MKLPRAYSDLREFAILHYRAQSGFIAPNMPVCEDYSDLTLYFYNAMKYSRTERFGCIIHKSAFECKLCNECRYGIMSLFETIMLFSQDEPFKCEICGEYTSHGIPF